MVFNPDITKQGVEILFSNKKKHSQLDPLTFNGIPVKKVSETKHLGMILDSRLSFNSHLDEKLARARQGLGVMKQIKKWVTQKTLEIVYKMYIRPHLEYGDLVFDKADQRRTSVFSDQRTNYTNSCKVESIQYQAARVAIGAWKSSEIKETYTILGWESLESRRTFRKLALLYQILKQKSPTYLYNIIATQEFREGSRKANSLELKSYPSRTLFYRKSFFPSVIVDWNRLDLSIKTALSKSVFKKRLLNLARPKKQSYFGITDNNKVRHLTTLRLKLSPLNAHKFAYNFDDTPYPYCRVCETIEYTPHFLVHCRSYKNIRTNLYNNISVFIGSNVSSIPKRRLVSILLYGMEDMPDSVNKLILEEVANFIFSSKRMEKPKTVLVPVPGGVGGGRKYLAYV